MVDAMAGRLVTLAKQDDSSKYLCNIFAKDEKTAYDEVVKALGEIKERVEDELKEGESSFSAGGIKDKIYNFNTHVMLYSYLYNNLKSLQNGGFVGKCGSNTGVIIGPKGCGKSTVLESFVYYVAAYDPHLIGVYIKLDTGKIHGGKSIISWLAKCCFDDNVDFDNVEDSGERVFRFIQLCKLYNKKVFVILDEFDKVFQLNAGEEDMSKVKESLDELIWCSSDRSGCLFVILCGSSYRLPNYISKTGVTEDEKMDFPILEKSPHMNGTKFRTVRVRCPSPTSLEVVKTVVEKDNDENDLDYEQRVRHIAYYCGSNIRAIERAVESNAPETIERPTLPEELEPLYKLVIGLMVKENAGIFTALKENSSSHANMCPERFKPLMVEAFEKEDRVKLERLADSDALVLQEESSENVLIYPISLDTFLKDAVIFVNAGLLDTLKANGIQLSTRVYNEVTEFAEKHKGKITFASGVVTFLFNFLK